MMTFKQAAENKALRLAWQRHDLLFNFSARTSRGAISTKPSWILRFTHPECPRPLYGEVNILNGLSIESTTHFEESLIAFQESLNIGNWPDGDFWDKNPALSFAVEMAEIERLTDTAFELFPSDFTRGKASIPINGLVWMDNVERMYNQALAKIEAGFSCIKLKVGAEDFDLELALLSSLRKSFSPNELTIRVDANGAFAPSEALEKLKRLSDMGLHSIEQPIRQGNRTKMAELCRLTPLPIALDEELIGVHSKEEKHQMLDEIRPAYIILKPALLGGLAAADVWIEAARERNVGWWATSALESNIGLNAIAQWVFEKQTDLPQGLGTGQLYHNNFPSPLYVAGGELSFDRNKLWDMSQLPHDQWH